MQSDGIAMLALWTHESGTARRFVCTPYRYICRMLSAVDLLDKIEGRGQTGTLQHACACTGT